MELKINVAMRPKVPNALALQHSMDSHLSGLFSCSVKILTAVAAVQGHPGTVNLPELDLKLQVRLEPGAGPALSLCVLDPEHTGLLTVEQVRIGLRQCGVNLTATETQILVPEHSIRTPLGRRVRCVGEGTRMRDHFISLYWLKAVSAIARRSVL